MVKVSITKYRFKPWNLGFLGVMTMVITALIFPNIKSVWIQLPIIMVGWWICEWLIEKEVNNWLFNEAEVTINE